MSPSRHLAPMPALEFRFQLWRLALAKLRGLWNKSGYWEPGGPVGLTLVPVPVLPAEDWVRVKTALCGICGSDLKELTLDGAPDNPLQTFLSFPQIMGHEVVGTVEEVGPRATRVKSGDRVAVSPWLPCRPRGIAPECPRCQAGEFTHCRNFQRGRLPAGMHLGVTRGYGGFAPYLAAHESQCFVIPEGVSFAAAVLADPFSVAFHSCLLLEPARSATVLVHGLGVIGLLTVLCLKKIFGVERVFTSRGSRLVEEIAAYTGAELYTPERGSKWTLDGVDAIVDTIASAATLEAGMRCLRTRGRLVFTGVSTPRRTENTPHYFKELELIGSNAFAVETYQGRTAQAFEFFLDFLAERRISPTPLVTHRFPLDQYQPAFNALAGKGGSAAVKVVFTFE